MVDELVSDIQKVSVLIDKDLYETFRKDMAGLSFSTVDDFINYSLRLQVHEGNENPKEEDDHKVIDRLRALGYL